MPADVQVGSVAAFEDIDNIQISRADFMHALDEVQPAFGVSEEELQAVVQNGIIHYSQRVNVSGKPGRADTRISSKTGACSWNRSATLIERLSSAHCFMVSQPA